MKDNQGAEWDRVERGGPPNFSVQPVDPVEALRHLDPEGALSGIDLDDHEGVAIRAALDLWGQSLDPPRAGNAAIRQALKEALIGAGLWPAPRIEDDDQP